MPLSNLLYLDDWFSLKKLLSGKPIKVSLVDHNHGKEHVDLNSHVVEIIGKKTPLFNVYKMLHLHCLYQNRLKWEISMNALEIW